MNLQEKLKDELQKLSPIERDVMNLRLGLNDGRPRTLEEIGQLFGVTKDQIGMIEAEALQKSENIVKETAIAFAYNSLKNCIFAERDWNISSFDYEKFKNDIDEILNENFSEKEIKVLNLRFGLTDGYQKTLNEIGKEMNLSGERIRQIESIVLRKFRNPSHTKKLREYLAREKKYNNPYYNLLSVIFAQPISKDSIDEMKLKALIPDILSRLSTREKDVLRLRFGLDDGRQRTLDEVGELFGVTKDTIRQVERNALEKLKHPDKMEYIQEHLDIKILL